MKLKEVTARKDYKCYFEPTHIIRKGERCFSITFLDDLHWVSRHICSVCKENK